MNLELWKEVFLRSNVSLLLRRGSLVQGTFLWWCIGSGFLCNLNSVNLGDMLMHGIGLVLGR